MLRGLSVALAQAGDTVSVIGRDKGKLERVVLASPENSVWPIQIDYCRQDLLDHALCSLVRQVGPISRTICWVHEEQSPLGPLHFAQYTSKQFYHILSSSLADPAESGPLERWRERFRNEFPNLEYHTVILGFKTRRLGYARWLTHDEISQGVLRTLGSKRLQHIVGVVSPWSARP